MWKWIVIGITGLGIMVIRRRMAGAICRSRVLMTGKTIIITGASTGIGKATALELARRKARLILACRDVQAGEKVADEIRSKDKNFNVSVKKLDLASIKSIKQFAFDVIKSEDQLDVLINNAGVYRCPYSLTEDGLEQQMGVNYFGHFLLTNLLLEKLKSSAPSRVVIVSSGLSKHGLIDLENLSVQESSYDPARAYSNSKLASNYFARELSRRLDESKVHVCCVRPGMARTDLGRHVQPHQIIRFLLWPLAWLLVKSPREACQTIVYCSVASELDGASGNFYSECKEEEWENISNDPDLARHLWHKSEEITGIR